MTISSLDSSQPSLSLKAFTAERRMVYDMDGIRISSEVAWQVKKGFRIGRRAISLLKITNEDLRASPTWEPVRPRLWLTKLWRRLSREPPEASSGRPDRRSGSCTRARHEPRPGKRGPSPPREPGPREQRALQRNTADPCHTRSPKSNSRGARRSGNHRGPRGSRTEQNKAPAWRARENHCRT